MAVRASDTLRRWFREVWDEGRPEAIPQIFPAHGKAHGLGDKPVVGPVEYLAFWQGFRAAYGDTRIQVVDSVDEGEKCYVRCQATMKHHGAPVTLEGGCLAIVRGGQIVECWNFWDFPTLFVQTGAMAPDDFGRFLLR